MALAVHYGGPADGAEVPGVEQTQTRHYLNRNERNRRTWLPLARYVFVPPRDGARCVYQFSGLDQVQGPVLGDEKQPDWSVPTR